jgi:hypothetical protein
MAGEIGLVKRRTGNNAGQSLASEKDGKNQLVVLAVGDLSNWRSSGRSLPWDSQITFADFVEVDRHMIENLDPGVVLSPLMCTTFDCLDLAQALQSAGYRGRYRIMSPKLPDPGIVLAETRGMCPGLDVEFIIDQFSVTGATN